MTGEIFTARGLLARPDKWVVDGGILVVEGGIERLLESPEQVRRTALEYSCPVVDLGEGVMTPGLVCAHAHLDLSALAGQMESGMAMLPWIRAVMRCRRELDSEARDRAAIDSAIGLTRTGTTLVGDIDSMSGSAIPALKNGPRRIAFREVLDGGNRERTEAALKTIERELPELSHRREGVSPHAPHTVSVHLMQRVAKLAGARSLPVQVHWSETPEELEWLVHGRGPFAELLENSPRRSGLDLLESTGLLNPSLSLVHGNCPTANEPARLAANGVAVVHCPGSHAFFDRAPFPLDAYDAAGVTLALGTDSLASNRALDMRLEMRLLRAAFPKLEPERAWRMATLGGARALGYESRVGELVPGARADFVLFELNANERGTVLDELTGGEPPVRAVWIDGQPALRDACFEQAVRDFPLES